MILEDMIGSVAQSSIKSLAFLAPSLASPSAWSLLSSTSASAATVAAALLAQRLTSLELFVSTCLTLRTSLDLVVSW